MGLFDFLMKRQSSKDDRKGQSLVEKTDSSLHNEINAIRRMRASSDRAQGSPHIPQIQKKSEKDDQKKKSSEVDTNLKCPHCGAIYRIGEDTIISTPEDVLKEFPNLAGMVDMSRPDLMTHITTVDNELRKNLNQINLKKIQAINTILEKGQSRYWYCSKCTNENNPCPYPSASHVVFPKDVVTASQTTPNEPPPEPNVTQRLSSESQPARLKEWTAHSQRIAELGAMCAKHDGSVSLASANRNIWATIDSKSAEGQVMLFIVLSYAIVVLQRLNADGNGVDALLQACNMVDGIPVFAPQVTAFRDAIDALRDLESSRGHDQLRRSDLLQWSKKIEQNWGELASGLLAKLGGRAFLE